jgi:hypothetical protein
VFNVWEISVVNSQGPQANEKAMDENEAGDVVSETAVRSPLSLQVAIVDVGYVGPRYRSEISSHGENIVSLSLIPKIFQ